MNYDFIGKMETFKQDAGTLINTWNTKLNANIKMSDIENETRSSRVRL